MTTGEEATSRNVLKGPVQAGGSDLDGSKSEGLVGRRQFVALAGKGLCAGALLGSPAYLAGSVAGGAPTAPRPIGSGRSGKRDEAAKLARVSILTWGFSTMMKLPGVAPNPQRTLALFDLPEMFADRYGVHMIEPQDVMFESTEISYLKEFRSRVEKAKSRVNQIDLEFGPLTFSSPNPVDRWRAVDLTKQWIDHALVLGCGRVLVNQGYLTREGRAYSNAALKVMSDYGKSKGVKVAMEPRGAGRPPGKKHAPQNATPWAPNGTLELMYDAIKATGAYSNIDIGNMDVHSQQEEQEHIHQLLPFTNGEMHIKLARGLNGKPAAWNLPETLRYIVKTGYSGIFAVEEPGPPPTPYNLTKEVIEAYLANT